MRRRPACASAGRVTTAAVLLSLLAGLGSSNNMAPPPPPPPPPPHSTTATRDFSLRHVFHHGTDHYPQLHRRLDVPQQSADADADAAPGPRLRVKAAPLSIERLADRSREAVDGLLAWARSKGRPVLLAAADWTVDEVPAPNVTDRDTVLSLARMASDAYIPQPHTGEWQDVGGGFNYSDDFGWEADGLRGHIFADPHNATVVIGLKGTSPAMFDGSETTTKDKVNDNLFFSCCCGQGGQFLWRQVCDCQTSALTCNATCLATALRAKNHYYYAAQDLYHNVTGLYPNAEIWLAGHSLGGAVASLLSLTFGHPAVTFEAVPEAMPASRLGLPVPPGHQIGSLQQKRPMTGGFHFGHTADPIYMGQCNQATSVCTIGGYAMQSVCHTGMKCVYDTVKDFGWRVGIGTHKIVQVIHDVLEKYDAPAKCEPYLDCTDCYAWKYFESNGTETTTSHISKPTSTSTSTPTSKSKPNSRTRTETCKTPGWWGCLDESTSHAKTSSKTTSTWSTSTCKTPGWFGCKDDNGEKTSSKTKHTTSPVPAPTVTTTSSSPTSTSSCRYPGWFGDCLDGYDPPSRTTVRTSTASPTAFTSSCTHEGWFGLICYDKTKKHSTSSTSAASSPCCTSDGWSGLVCYDKSKKHQHTMTERLEM